MAAMGAAIIGLGLFEAAPAAAQGLTRTWVAANGDNANPCTETQPCRTFQRAVNRAANGGEVNCLNSGAFGPVQIDKSISIICDRDQAGIIGTTAGMLIAGAPDIVVTISGLDFEGLGQTGSGGAAGIVFVSGGVLHVRNTKVRGFRGAYGILFTPVTDASLILEDVVVSETGCPCVPNSGGVGIFPMQDVTAKVSIFGLSAHNNLNAALRFDTSGVTGATISATVADSRLSLNGNGLIVKSPAGTGSAKLMIVNTIISQNGFGVILNGPLATGRIDGSTISGNTTGLLLNGGAKLQSYGTNTLGDNTTDGAFSLPALTRS